MIFGFRLSILTVRSEGLSQMKNSQNPRVADWRGWAHGKNDRRSCGWRSEHRHHRAMRSWRFDRTADEKLRCGYRF